MLAKHQEARVSYRHLWRLFEACLELETEGATRVSMTHLLLQYGEEQDLSVVLEGLGRIWRQIGLSKALQGAVNAWWRRYTHRLSITQLQQLERELEPQRQLEPQKHILYSVLAMRRWLHSQDPVELAESINTTYTILEHITEAFDAEHIHEIDSGTIRRRVGRSRARALIGAAPHSSEQPAQPRPPDHQDGGETQQTVAHSQR